MELLKTLGNANLMIKIIDYIQTLVILIFIVCLIFKLTKTRYFLKGFLSLIAFLAILLFFIMGFDKFFDWACDNTPWMILIFILLAAIFIILIFSLEMKKNYKKNPEETKKYMKFQIENTISQIKILAIGLGIGALIFGVIFFVIKNL